jgi:hypothetical protein
MVGSTPTRLRHIFLGYLMISGKLYQNCTTVSLAGGAFNGTV